MEICRHHILNSHSQLLFMPIGRKTEVIVGILKIGKKRLFLAVRIVLSTQYFVISLSLGISTSQDSKGALHEVEPLCVLDFYVHESRQRCGFGKQLFEYMLTVCLISHVYILTYHVSPHLLE